nr:MAG TPA: hypothetical protein [Caudoviricetes sp.]
MTLYRLGGYRLRRICPNFPRGERTKKHLLFNFQGAMLIDLLLYVWAFTPPAKDYSLSLII